MVKINYIIGEIYIKKLIKIILSLKIYQTIFQSLHNDNKRNNKL